MFHSGKFWNIPAGSMIEHPDGEMSHLVHGDYNHSLIGHHGVVQRNNNHIAINEIIIHRKNLSVCLSQCGITEHYSSELSVATLFSITAVTSFVNKSVHCLTSTW